MLLSNLKYAENAEIALIANGTILFENWFHFNQFLWLTTVIYYLTTYVCMTFHWVWLIKCIVRCCQTYDEEKLTRETRVLHRKLILKLVFWTSILLSILLSTVKSTKSRLKVYKMHTYFFHEESLLCHLYYLLRGILYTLLRLLESLKFLLHLLLNTITSTILTIIHYVKYVLN